MDVDRLKDAKDLFAKGTLSPEDKQKIQSHKETFPEDDAELAAHLETLNVSELTEYLLWIPFNRFQNLEILGEGGFARVWKATVHWPGADEDELYALKEIDISMSPEVN
ncbi:hypothetical protein BC938DRAFT_473977 [Jimgerdemannia flammicorona]|uniref:Protein kinase domain-containing protein n=2 Tax=Jimgerdemannia flammicorona TaxID=994334 RepID=A0A433QSW1_9FUNG|nr:hypothetical protein BC938DRAFT_473977 [Jimgerdemannia flammicorona]